MKHLKRLSLSIVFLLLIFCISGCGRSENTKTESSKKEFSREAQIKQSFNKTLKLYPTKNLDDFYDKEGFRD